MPRITNIKPKCISSSSDTLIYPTSGKRLSDVVDPVAEWEASGPLDATISGDLANPRDHSVLLVATVEAIPCSIKHIDGVSKEQKTSLPKLANFTCSEIFVDHKQNGVHPRQTEDGSFSVEVCISSAGAGSCLPAFTVQAIERLPDSTAKQTNINVKLDDQNTEHQVINHFDKTSSNKDIRYVWRDGYVQGEDELENLQNLMEVWVSLYIGGYNAFVRWAPRVPVEYQWSATDWAQKWEEAQVSSECAQIDIEVEAFRNVNIDFYEYDKWLDTEPNLSDLTKWGGTQRVGVVYAPGSAKFKDPGSSSNNLSLSFDKDRRTVYYPGTTVYCVFGNCKEFTYDLEYLTDVNEVLDEVLTNSDTSYFHRDLEGSISPERLLSFPGISLKLAMPEHMGTSDCFSILIGTFDVITVKRRAITTGDPYNGNLDATARTFVSTLPVSPFGDGLLFTKKDIIHTHARRTVSQTHGARRMVYYSKDMWNALLYVFAPVPPTTASGFLAALRTEYDDNFDGGDPLGEFFLQEKPDGYIPAYDTDGDIVIPEVLDSYEDRVRSASDPIKVIDQIRAEWNAVPYDLGYDGATVGRGIYRIKHETQTVMELEIKYLRGYHDVGGIVRLGQDTWKFEYGVTSTGSVMGTQTGYALAGYQLEFATGGEYTFPTTHDPNETRIYLRYGLPTVQINDGVPFELDGTRKLYGIHSDPQYNNEWGNIFADLRSKVLVLTDPSSIELSIYGDKLYGDADHQIDLASLNVGKNDLQMAEFDLPFTVTAEHSFISGARLIDASYKMAVILTPAELVLTSDSNFHGLDGEGITDHVVLNSPHDYYYVPALFSVFDVRNVNAGNLLSHESCPFSLTESKVSVHFKYGKTQYRSQRSTVIPPDGCVELSQWQNPSSPDGRNLRPDKHVKLKFSSRSHPWVVTKKITGGAYELVVLEQDESGTSWTKSTTSLGVDLMATETPLRFKSDAGDMGVEIVLHDRFFDEADIHEGFAWEVAAANTPLLCKAPRYIDQNSGSSTETVPLAQDPLMILNENEFKTHKFNSTTGEMKAVMIKTDEDYQIELDDRDKTLRNLLSGSAGYYDTKNGCAIYSIQIESDIEIDYSVGPDEYRNNIKFEFEIDAVPLTLTWWWDTTSESYLNYQNGIIMNGVNMNGITFQFFDDGTLVATIPGPIEVKRVKGTYMVADDGDYGA